MEVLLQLSKCYLSPDQFGALECRDPDCEDYLELRQFTGAVRDCEGAYFFLQDGIVHHETRSAHRSHDGEYYYLYGQRVAESFDGFCRVVKAKYPEIWNKLMASRLGTWT